MRDLFYRCAYNVPFHYKPFASAWRKPSSIERARNKQLTPSNSLSHPSGRAFLKARCADQERRGARKRKLKSQNNDNKNGVPALHLHSLGIPRVYVTSLPVNRLNVRVTSDGGRRGRQGAMASILFEGGRGRRPGDRSSHTPDPRSRPP